MRTFFTVTRVDCKRNGNGEPLTTVTFQFGKEGSWRTDRRWYHVDDVVVAYPGNPLHMLGNEYPDIDGPMRKLLDLDGDPFDEK